MNKGDFILFISERTGVEPEIIREQIDEHIELLKEFMEDHEDLSIKNFGTFRMKKVSPGMVRNPKTGESVHSDGHRRISFSGLKKPL